MRADRVLLDVKIVRENPEVVRENLRKRGLVDRLTEIDQLLQSDETWRRLQSQADQLRKKRNEITAAIADARRRRVETSGLMREADAIPDKIKRLESDIGEEREKVDKILLNLPNLVDASVPFGKGEEDNVEIRKW